MSTLEPNLFCHAVPPDWDNPHAVKLCVSLKDKARLAEIPRGEENILCGIVAFDKICRKWYAIRHFPCFVDSFDCCCAAQAVQVEGRDSVYLWESIEFPPDEEDEDYCPHCGRSH